MPLGLPGPPMPGLQTEKAGHAPTRSKHCRTILKFSVSNWLWPGNLERGRRGRAEPNFDTLRADAIHDMGRYLRKCRKTKKYTLRQVAAWSGVSAAQLSRIERGECADSRIIGVVDEDKYLHKDEQRLTFTNQIIREIYHGTFIPPDEK